MGWLFITQGNDLWSVSVCLLQVLRKDKIKCFLLFITVRGNLNTAAVQWIEKISTYRKVKLKDFFSRKMYKDNAK